MTTFRAYVTIECANEDEVLRIVAERIDHDEDYGFDYSIDCDRVEKAS